ncbi:hypothetical protein BFW01_g9990 [Lasiodiplodia theobromae]|nr:hypothetical protein BFW01_g9990 [Lasiodiplodia theobromae]
MAVENPFLRVGLTCLIWTLLLLLGSLQVANLVIQIIFATKYNSNVDGDSLEFALYKNSRFQNCSSRSPPPTVDCSVINGHLSEGKIYKDYINQGQNYLNQLNYYNDEGNTASGVKYTWCDLASCLNGFRVIPSTPRDSAFTFTGIELWANLNLIAITALLALRTEFFKSKEKCPYNCKGMRAWDWPPIAHAIVQSGLWCYSFVTLASDPHGASPMSVISWVTPWIYAYGTQYHPLACAFADDHPRRKKVVLATLVVATAAQWIASCYVFSVEYYALATGISHDPSRRYDCVAAWMEAAPPGAAAQCLPEQLCGRDWLFKDPGLQSYMDVTSAIYLAAFAVWSGGLVLPFFAFGIGWLGDGVLTCRWGSMRDGIFLRLVRFFRPIWFIAPIAGAIVYFGINLLVRLGKSWNELDREAGVVYDMDCRVVHVSLSPWKQYLDVDDGRVLRIVASWFNA